MTKQEAYEAGLKLLGIYFTISGIAILATTLVGLLQYRSTAGAIDARIFKSLLYSFFHPGTQIILGMILIRKTNSIVDKLTGKQPRTSA